MTASGYEISLRADEMFGASTEVMVMQHCEYTHVKWVHRIVYFKMAKSMSCEFYLHLRKIPITNGTGGFAIGHGMPQF